MNRKQGNIALSILIVTIMIGSAVYQSVNQTNEPIIKAQMSFSSRTVNVNELVVFDGSSSIGNELTYFWSFPFDNVTQTQTSTVTHRFSTPGHYQISLLIQDIFGLWDVATADLTVQYVQPQVDINVPEQAFEDEIIDFASSVIAGSPDLEYLWNFGDGENSTEPSVSHRYRDQGNYLVSLLVKDEKGGIDFKYTEIEIVNKPPLAIAEISHVTAFEDEVITFNGTQSRDTENDLTVLDYLWEFGDGSVSDQALATHKYTNEGVYDVKLTVLDDNSKSSSLTFEIVVTNSRPNVAIISSGQYFEGQTYIFKAAVEDDPTDKSQIIPQWNNGLQGSEISLLALKEGIYEINTTVMDNNGLTSSAEEIIEVENVAPTASIFDITTITNISVHLIGNIAENTSISLLQQDQPFYEFNLTQLNILWWKENIENVELDLSDNWFINIEYTPSDEDWFKFGFIIVILNNDPGLIVETHAIFNLFPNTYDTTIPLNEALYGFPIELSSSIFDPGIDDVDLKWVADTNPNSSLVKSYHSDTQGPTSIIDHTNMILLRPGLEDLAAYLNSFFNGSWVDNAMGDLAPYYSLLLANCINGVFGNITTIADRILDKWDMDHIFFIAVDNDNSTVLQLEVIDSDGGKSQHFIQINTTDGIEFHNIGSLLSIETSHEKIFEDDEITFSVNMENWSGSPDTEVLWTFGDGTTIVQRLDTSITHAYKHQGDYIITITIIGINKPGFSHLVLHVDNQKPELEVMILQNVFEDEPIHFDASGSSDTTSDIDDLMYFWDFGNGVFAHGREVDYAYTDEGNYTLTVVVTDNNGLGETRTEIIEVTNQVPLFIMESSFDEFEGNIVSLTLDIQESPSDYLDLHYAWEMSGEIVSNSRSFSQYFDNGQYTIKLSATDDDGSVGEHIITLNIVNLKPQASPLRHGFYGQLGWEVDFNSFVWDSPVDITTLTLDWKLTTFGSQTISLVPTKTGPISYKSSLTVNTLTDEFYDNVLVVNDDVESNTVKTTFHTTTDSDGDLLSDFEELTISETSPTDFDTDDDKLLDIIEPFLGTDPLLEDSDEDGLWDGYNMEVGFGEMTLGTSPNDNDTDDDGLIDGTEVFGWEISVITKDGNFQYTVYSDPTMDDTDGDGVLDYVEYLEGSDPWLDDTDRDGLLDDEEIELNTNLANYDTDGDDLEDGDELDLYEVTWQTSKFGGGFDTHSIWVGSDPTSADTDGDGLSDYEERFAEADGAITDANNEDTDGDGAVDGGEQYVYRHTIGERLLFNQETSHILPILTNVAGRVSKAELYMSSSGPSKDITIAISRLISIIPFEIESVTLTPDLGDGPISSVSLDITSSFGSFNGFQGWAIQLGHPGSNYEFIVEELTFVFTIEMNNLNNDMDGDLIIDGEEIAVGDDGWVTDPHKSDTDGDGLSDLEEVSPIFGPEERTNPTLADTDGDGFNDNNDEFPFDNMLISIELVSVRTNADVDGELGWGNLFGIIYAQTEDDATYFYVTKHKNFNSKETINYNYKYYFEADDDLIWIDYKIDIWDRDSPTDDDFIVGFSTSYNVNTREYHDTIEIGDVEIEFRIKTELIPHVPTYLINVSTVIEDDYGDLKYVGDEQFYIFYVQLCIEIIPGICFPIELISILVSRATIVHSRLNETFLEGSLTDVPSYLRDFNFSTDDYTDGDTMKLISGVLSGTMTYSELNSLFTLLTTNSTGHTTGEALLITDQLLKLGIPPEITNMIPIRGFSNSDVDELPKTFFDRIGEVVDAVINVVVDVIEFVASGVVAVANFLVHIVEIVASIGKEVLGSIEEVFDVVVEIVEKIVDIIGRIIDFVIEQLQSLLQPFVDAIMDILNNIVLGLATDLVRIYQSLNVGAANFNQMSVDGINIIELLLAVTNIFSMVSALGLLVVAFIVFLKLFDLWVWHYTGGTAQFLSLLKPYIKPIAIALIFTFIISALGQVGIVVDEALFGGDILDGVQNQLGFFADITVGGITLVNVLIALGVKKRATMDKNYGMKPYLDKASTELYYALLSLLAFILRVITLIIINNTSPDDTILGFNTVKVLWVLVLIFDLFSLGFGVTAAYIGLSIAGKLRRQLGVHFKVLNPIIDLLPYIVIFLGVFGIFSDGASLFDAFTNFENEAG